MLEERQISRTTVRRARMTGRKNGGEETRESAGVRSVPRTATDTVSTGTGQHNCAGGAAMELGYSRVSPIRTGMSMRPAVVCLSTCTTGLRLP